MDQNAMHDLPHTYADMYAALADMRGHVSYLIQINSGFKHALKRGMDTLRGLAPAIWQNPELALQIAEDKLEFISPDRLFKSIATEPEVFGALVKSRIFRTARTARWFARKPLIMYEFLASDLGDNLQGVVKSFVPRFAEAEHQRHKLHDMMCQAFGTQTILKAIDEADARFEAHKAWKKERDEKAKAAENAKAQMQKDDTNTVTIEATVVAG